MYTFEDRVKNAKLTKSNRLIAEYCLSNQSTIAFQSAADLAACIGVSDVSIVRFARVLGYEGFVDMKHAWQEELSQFVETGAESVNPVAKYLSRKHQNQGRQNFTFENAEETYCHMIHDSLAGLTPAALDTMAERIYSSRNKFIVGIRSRATPANAMAFVLRMAVPGVTSITSEGYVSFMKMLDLGPEDCVVFFTFGRFSVMEQSLLARVKESGAYLIVITDKKASRAAQAADQLIYCVGDINLFFYSSVGTVMLSECIANAIQTRHWEECQKRIEQSEIFLNKNTPK